MSTRRRVWSLNSLRGFRIWRRRGCGVGWQLVWETPYATGAAVKKPKEKPVTKLCKNLCEATLEILNPSRLCPGINSQVYLEVSRPWAHLQYPPQELL